MSVSVLHGDCRAVLVGLPADSVQMVCTSPPYFGLRDYNVVGQLGLEATPDAYIAALVAAFREVRRVLRPDGVCWLNLGDSYANDGKWGGASGGKHVTALHGNTGIGRLKVATGAKPKDLLLMPARVALALQSDGWWLRSDCIWHKPNPLPEPVRDRPTSAHEHVFLLTKSATYFYDADAIKEPGEMRPQNRHTNGRGQKSVGYAEHRKPVGMTECDSRNKRSVWTINTQAYPGAHFAVMPDELATICILAGTSERGACRACGAPWIREIVESADPRTPYASKGTGAKGVISRNDGHGLNKVLRPGGGDLAKIQRTTIGWNPSCGCNAGKPVPCVVLDPFGGAGTTGAVAHRLGRSAILIELNSDYCRMAERRWAAETPSLFGVMEPLT